MRIILIFPLLLLTAIVLGQSGNIAGKVIENETAYEVIGANVIIDELGIGAASDLDGSYLIKDLKPGIYSISCSYLGFDTKVIKNVEVKANETTTVDIKLGESTVQMQTVQVTATRKTNTSTALLTTKKESTSVLDGVSAQEISKSGDSDAAGAIKRISGVTVEGGKYVYVRGLGDRYSKTTLNGADIPGLDPNKNTVQMDLFPTNLLDNILVYKSFTPELPGDFTGGYIDIATKDFPTNFTFNASVSLGYNSNATFNKDFLAQKSGKLDFLGFDDGGRAIPAEITNSNGVPSKQENNNSGFDATEASELVNMTNSFSNTWEQQNKMAPVNQSIALSAGNQFTFLGRPLGVIAAATYQRNYSYYGNGSYGVFTLPGTVLTSNSLLKEISLVDRKGTDEVLWGTMLTLSYKFTPTHKISFLAMRNQSGTSTTRFLEGSIADDPELVFQTRTSRYLQRGLTTFQLGGKHVFLNASQMELKWKASYAQSQQSDPDLRFFTNRYDAELDRYSFNVSDRTPSRFFRDMNQTNLSNKIDMALPFKQWEGLKSQFKAGLAHTYKNRAFNENRFTFTGSNVPFDGNVTNYFSEENLISMNETSTAFEDNGSGTFIVNDLDTANTYDANQLVLAGYAMVELPITRRLKLVTGLRVEKATTALKTYSYRILNSYPYLDGETPIMDNIDLLPAFNLNYDLSDRTKLRAAYSRTLARPSFRELALFSSFNVVGGYVFIGNPELKRTLIDNIDLRWEMYPTNKELISVSAFYKKFQNPIERTFNPVATDNEVALRNVASAFITGVELEMKKQLPFIKGLSANGNLSYIYSQTKIDSAELESIRIGNPDAAATRAMYGQSPYAANLGLGYKNDSIGLAVNLVFNVSGPRISVINPGGAPATYVMARPTLNFNITKNVGKGIALKFSATNLLMSAYREQIKYKGNAYEVSAYNPGINCSLGLKYAFAK